MASKRQERRVEPLTVAVVELVTMWFICSNGIHGE